MPGRDSYAMTREERRRPFRLKRRVRVRLRDAVDAAAGDSPLRLGRQIEFPLRLIHAANLISALQQPRSQLRMHSHCGCDDCMTDLLCAEPADRRGGHNPYLAVFLPEVQVIRHNPKKQNPKREPRRTRRFTKETSFGLPS